MDGKNWKINKKIRGEDSLTPSYFCEQKFRNCGNNLLVFIWHLLLIMFRLSKFFSIDDKMKDQKLSQK